MFKLTPIIVLQKEARLYKEPSAYRQNVQLRETMSSFNPIGHSEKLESKRDVNAVRQKTVNKKLGSTAHIFSEPQGSFLETPTKKTTGAN